MLAYDPGNSPDAKSRSDALGALQGWPLPLDGFHPRYVSDESDSEKELYPLLTHVTVILSYVLQNSIQTISILVVGRLGPDQLSAAAFSCMFAMVSGEYRLA